jgi:hypothetical protein
VIDKLWAEIREIGKEDPGAKRYYAEGTIQTVRVLNNVGAFPTKYWSLWE